MTVRVTEHQLIARRCASAKHGRHFFDTLVMPAAGRPWLPATQ
jgi:hypothetical protein